MNPAFDFQVIFDFTSAKPVVVEPSAEQFSSDAGLLPLRQLDEQLPSRPVQRLPVRLSPVECRRSV